ncbi:LCP family protein [Ktedonobacter racemifer]|uniref:Cell envelope-related transcriptional attenuator n=1 Tax=Ktedonobacter racemifer DSM 44963 TaxID=485913 RepID=D6TF26_KTERA|nr:LCP family protein [Ktedonobacter racemifer]EFH90426.1 cell envelope-related transcriptional attenuator [Ktedonobacter racemifer DSM 44963]
MKQYPSDHTQFDSQLQQTPRPHIQAFSRQTQPHIQAFSRQTQPHQFKHPSVFNFELTPPQKQASRRYKKNHIGSYVFLTFFLLAILISVAGYFQLGNPLQAQLAKFLRPVNKAASIEGHAWNFLLLGSDNDAKYTFPQVLTQVVIVVRVDPIHNHVTMLSLPRDSWVWVPEANGMYKLDQAFYLGTQHANRFEDGVLLTEKTLAEDYGIKIDRYAWIGLDGFAKLINTMGGIDIEAHHPIVDDAYPDDTRQQADPDKAYNNAYNYTRLYLPPGPQHLSGAEALKYVRSRHGDLVGDFGRNQRQQQVLEALRQKLTLTNVITHFASLLNDMQGDTYTDLDTGELLNLANFARTLDTHTIEHITLGPGQNEQDYGTAQEIYDATTDTTQAVILPECAALQPLLNHVFALDASTHSCNVQDRNSDTEYTPLPTSTSEPDATSTITPLPTSTSEPDATSTITPLPTQPSQPPDGP